MKSLNIGIIGGGITGLVLGYYLSKNGHRPTIFEKDSEPGGLLSTVKICGRPLEKYYHHIFNSDKYTVELFKDLALSEQIEWLRSSIGVFLKEKSYPFSTSLDLLRFPHLSFLSKLRSGLATIFLQHYKNWKNLKNIKASDWIRKYMGEEVWQILWQPLFQGKFGEYFNDIAMSWFWSRIHARSAAKFMGRETLGYPKSSYQEIIDRLVKKISQNNGKIFSKTPVERLALNNSKNIDIVAGGGLYNFDLVISTIAPPLFSQLLPDNFKEYKQQLSSVIYLGNISTILILKEKLTDYYWTNILDRDISFAGIIEHTNLVDSARYQNKHIVYISHYAPSDSEYFVANNKDLLNQYLNDLEKINPRVKAILEDAVVFRAPYAQPVITSDYPYETLEFRTPIKNLYQLSMAQIFPEDRGVDSAIREAKKLVNLILTI